MLVQFNHLFVVIKFDKPHSNATAMLMTLFKCLQQKLITYHIMMRMGRHNLFVGFMWHSKNQRFQQQVK